VIEISDAWERADVVRPVPSLFEPVTHGCVPVKLKHCQEPNAALLDDSRLQKDNLREGTVP
jgi:hypothetical protein